MATDELTIKGFVEFLLRGKGLKDAQQGVKDTGSAADKASKKLNKMQRAGDALGRKLKTALGAAAIVALVKSSLTQFAHYERGLLAIGRQLQNLGHDADAAVPRVREFLESLESSTGVLRQEALPTFQKFLGITKSLEGAMFATRLSADLTGGAWGKMQTSGERLANLLQGEVTEAAKSLGLNVRNANGAMKTQVELLDELIARDMGFAAAQKDAQANIEKLISAWNQFQQQAGKALAPALKVVADNLENVGRIARSLGPIFTKTFLEVAQEAISLGNRVAAALNLKRLITEGPDAYRAAIVEAGIEGRERFKEAISVADDELVAIWMEKGRKVAEGFEAGRAEVTAVAAAKQEAADRAAADKRLEFEKKAEAQLLQARAAAAEEGSQRQLDLHLQLLAKQRDASLAAAAKLGADTTAINEQFEVEAEALREEFRKAAEEKAIEARRARVEAELQSRISLLDSEIELLREGDARKLELLKERLELERQLELENTELTEEERQRIIDEFKNKVEKGTKDSEKEQARIRKEAKLQDIALQQTWAAATFSVLSTLFGQNKALAIAETMFHTFKGAQKALAENPPPSPVGIASAAFVIATGIKRAADIRKQNPGFDDPAHDRLARLGSRKWAEDLVRQIDLGFGEGLQAAFPRLAPSSSVTNNTTEDHSMNVSFGSAPLGGRASARRIARVLKRAQARDSSRRLA